MMSSFVGGIGASQATSVRPAEAGLEMTVSSRARVASSASICRPSSPIWTVPAPHRREKFNVSSTIDVENQVAAPFFSREHLWMKGSPS